MSPWLPFMVMLLCFSFNDVADARHRKQLHSSAIVVGTVYCDTCFRQETPKSSTHFISGAKVAVECGGDGGKGSFRVEVKTNEKGEFEAKLPVSVGRSVEKIKGCSVRLISSGEPYCAVAATATSSEIRFKSKKSGSHVFSAGFFTFKPELCNQKDFTGKGFPPALPDPASPFLPPIGEGILPPLPVPVPDLPMPPLLPPLPQVPGIPQLPGVPLPPVVSRQKSSESGKLTDQKTFGFPFQPPPLLPPLPLVPSPPSLIPPVIPTPPPSLFPPLFPSPPSSLFPPLPLPPVPGLMPSPPPPPPAFPIPLPPLPPLPSLPPMPPLPGFPTVPPAKTSP